MIGGSALGRMTENMILSGRVPEEREAITNSNSRIRKNSDRVMRATAVHDTMPMAKVIMGNDAPKRATITIANRSVGRT